MIRRLRTLSLPGGVRLWVSAASVAFLASAVVSHGRQLLQLSLDRQSWLWLALGLGISALSLVVNGLAWGVVLRWLGAAPRWTPVVLLFLESNLRKYLPGGVWHLLERLRALRSGGPCRQPLSGRQALGAVLLDPLLMAVAALSLVALGGGLALLALLPLLALMPRWLNPLLERLERRRAKALEVDPSGLTPGSLRLPGYPWWPLAAELVFVLCRFGGFACCVQAFDLAFQLDWTGWLAGFALAWTAGLVVPAAPGGLGVFEAVLVLRLAASVPEAPLLAVALSYRLVVSLADLLVAAAARRDLAALRNSGYC
ncbi:lysylphosphatidylglycerol synthase domain-containing protein [Synechococcus sp. A10-1-5-1]|uniref:lysylphosphatidylglycerol synthase domain-containing protein n=1 Tax=Synechococcus sp. A10-1-5-1 TaxID=2936507 RepID=UPI003530364B